MVAFVCRLLLLVCGYVFYGRLKVKSDRRHKGGISLMRSSVGNVDSVAPVELKPGLLKHTDRMIAGGSRSWANRFDAASISSSDVCTLIGYHRHSKLCHNSVQSTPKTARTQSGIQCALSV